MLTVSLVGWSCWKIVKYKNKNPLIFNIFSGLYRDVQSICLSVTWRAEDKKQQVLDGKVRAPSYVKRQLFLTCRRLEKCVNTEKHQKNVLIHKNFLTKALKEHNTTKQYKDIFNRKPSS